MSSKLDLKSFAIATLVPIVMMLVAMWIKPLWRDEFFSLYYSEPGLSLPDLAENRWVIDAHPPLHNIFLWVWSHISEHVFWQKALSLVFLGIGAFACFQLSPTSRRRTLYIFGLTCLGSYWVIYFATEIRPYILNFTLSTVLTLAAVRLIEDEQANWPLWTIWIVTGALLSLTHYFGALWFACLGLMVGIHHLTRGQNSRFFRIGSLTVLGLVPALLWIKFALTQIDLSNVTSDLTALQKLQGGLHQFLRGLLVKTFGSNPLITILGFGGILAAIFGRNYRNRVLLGAAGLMLLIALVLHIALADMIKERAFISMMPAVLYIFADHIADKESSWMKYIPLAAVIMPFLFIPEYFKNKERIDEFQAALNSYGPACETAAIPVLLRPDPPRAFYEFAAQKIVSPDGKRQLAPLDISQTFELASDCPVVAVSVLLPKNSAAIIDLGNTHLMRLGQDPSKLEVRRFGKGRNIFWVRRP
ncbi:MAG: hypothetical protein HKN36_10095 [Hellea sp.]|nr:hypothetical protein [Hellea sp.]